MNNWLCAYVVIVTTALIFIFTPKNEGLSPHEMRELGKEVEMSGARAARKALALAIDDGRISEVEATGIRSLIRADQKDQEEAEHAAALANLERVAAKK